MSFPVHGWVVIDKPRGLSSAAAVAHVKRLFAAQKAGHGGTLDPLASGVLPVALGEATKTVAALLDAAKTYRFTLAWGAETSSGDLEGEVVRVSPLRPDVGDIEAALPRFTGEIEQVPPAFSAIKIAGERAYGLARAGKPVVLAPRKVRVDCLRLVACGADDATLELTCGKGTYVRSLARDLARVLGTAGHVAALRRLAVGRFGEDWMIPLDKLEELGHKGAGREAIMTVLRPLETVLDDIPALALSEAEAGRLRQGQAVLLELPEVPSPQDTVLVLSGNRPVALAGIDGGMLRPKRVFNL